MFITFEGIDGSGKSTQAKMFAQRLSDQYKKEVVLTREPGGWEGGCDLRRMVRNGELQHPWSEVFLFMLDRCEHVSTVIAPALSEGKIVLCDRYHDSTLAYQSWGRGLPLDVLDLLACETGFPMPDITFFFDIYIETALERAFLRSGSDAFEREGMPFMERVREGYITLAKRDPARWITIDCADRGADDVFQMAFEAVKKRGFFSD